MAVTLQELPAMKSAVVQQLQTAAQDAMQAQRVAYSSLWEAAASSASMLEIQRRLLQTLKQTGHMSTVCLRFALPLSLPLSPSLPPPLCKNITPHLACVYRHVRVHLLSFLDLSFSEELVRSFIFIVRHVWP